MKFILALLVAFLMFAQTLGIAEKIETTSKITGRKARQSVTGGDSSYTSTSVNGAGSSYTSTQSQTRNLGSVYSSNANTDGAGGQVYQQNIVQTQPIEMNAVLRPGEYVPNCGCVSRGACMREIGHYTRLVGQFSDVVCGLKFEKCCFDGPCPGVLDEYVRAAPCVPEERCLRPYGVLPTDVRDFGIIAPCPGHGAVRCIAVDDASLLEFQAAVAAIEASSIRYVETITPVAVAPVRPVAPVQVSVPVVSQPAAVSTTYTSSSAETPVAEIHTEPAPAVVSTGSSSSEFDLASILASTGITSSQIQSLTNGGVSSGQITSVVSSSRTPPVAVPAVVAPPATGFVPTAYRTGGYGFGCRSIGCYTPGAYRNYYGGYGYPGLGLGFSKRFHYSKGFGYGLY